MNHFIPEIIIILTISIIKIILKDIPNYKLMSITLLSNQVITMKGVITLPEKYTLTTSHLKMIQHLQS